MKFSDPRLSAAEIREKLLEAGARNCREFGYPDCTSEILLKHYIFRQFFKSMLEDEENVNLSPVVEAVRLKLIEEIDSMDAKKSERSKKS